MSKIWKKRLCFASEELMVTQQTLNSLTSWSRECKVFFITDQSWWMDGWMHRGCCSHKAVEESLFRPKWTQVTSTNFLFQLSIKQVTAMSPDSLTNHILIVAAVAWGANHRKRLLDEGWMTKTGFIIRLAWWSARLMQDAVVEALGFKSCL